MRRQCKILSYPIASAQVEDQIFRASSKSIDLIGVIQFFMCLALIASSESQWGSNLGSALPINHLRNSKRFFAICRGSRLILLKR